MASNTPFKKLVCSNPKCKQWKMDRTGKAKDVHCGLPMELSDNWYVRITVRGKLTTKSVSPRKRDAEKFIEDCREGRACASERDISWADAAENGAKWWSSLVTKKKISQATADHYAYRMVALTEFFEGHTLLTVSKGDLEDYMTHRAELGRAPATINHEVKALRKLYALHVDRTSSEESPKLCGKYADLSRVELIPKDGKKVRFLTEDEIKLLLGKATTPLVRIATLIALNTGLRRANVLDLIWKEVRLSDRVINLPAEKMKSRKDHTVDIPVHLVEPLKEWRASQPLSPDLFPGVNFRTEWDHTIEACGFTDVTMHTLRHTFASQFLMAGGDLSTLSEILAHADIAITKNIYGHLSREHKRKATDEFAAAFLSKF